MVDNDDLEGIFKGQVECIASSEAVASCTKDFDAPFLETGDDFVEGRSRLIIAMIRKPCREVESAARAQTLWGGRVIVQIIRDVSLRIVVNVKPVCQRIRLTWNPLRAKSSAKRRALINW